ncbi:metallophosphoesterase family protein [Humisphaera borealis]|uniref:Metallophosphoesterase n=1 Tax=Humisphaera borealis TaxID=2807512 RepID=A0A7M2WTJ3_9BACT|nr:metallophosphoesterase [Humisphaera borealis]QOV88845.1 metallophosphoesterase [Humisphaera borealis]
MIYRLLCCSDTHTEVPPNLDEASATAWLHAGDVVEGPEIVGDDSDPLQDFLRAPVARWFKERPLPVFVVKGNHDTVDDVHAFRHANDVTGRVVRIAESLVLAGIGWCGETYYELPLESDLRGPCDSVLRAANRILMPSDSLILLTHYPPRFPGMRELTRDVPNGGVWYDCVRGLVAELRPTAVVQGHVHSWAGTSQVVRIEDRDTTVFHPGKLGGILQVDTVCRTAEVSWPSCER